MTPHAVRLLDRVEDMGRVVERDLRRAQKRLKPSIPSYLRESRPLNLLVAPVVYSMILPIALLDAWVSLYQWVCFPLFRIARCGAVSTSWSIATSWPTSTASKK